MLRNKKLVVFGILGALVLLLGGVGVAYAYAQGPQPLGDGSFFREGRLCDEGPLLGGRLRGRGGPTLVRITAEGSGLSEDAVIEALEDGQTLAQIAEAEGVDPQEIVDAALAEAESRLQEAVNADRLTEERMEQILDRMGEELPERLEEPWSPGGPMSGAFGRFGEGFWTMYDAVAEALGLAPEELFSELHDGKTPAEIAEAQGVDMETVRDALEAARGELTQEAVERAVENGRMSREEADWLLEGIEEDFLPRARGFGRGSGGRPGRGGRGRGMGW